jgi:hypothetical protein
MKNKETLEEFIIEITKNFKDEMSIKFTTGGIKLGAKYMQDKTISKDAYEDSLNMQRCSNAGYENKISELENKIKQMYSEEEVLALLHKRDKHNIDNPDTFGGWETPKEWFKQLKKK